MVCCDQGFVKEVENRFEQVENRFELVEQTHPNEIASLRADTLKLKMASNSCEMMLKEIQETFQRWQTRQPGIATCLQECFYKIQEEMEKPVEKPVDKPDEQPPIEKKEKLRNILKSSVDMVPLNRNYDGLMEERAVVNEYPIDLLSGYATIKYAPQIGLMFILSLM